MLVTKRCSCHTTIRSKVMLQVDARQGIPKDGQAPYELFKASPSLSYKSQEA